MEKKTLMMEIRHIDMAWTAFMHRAALESGIPEPYIAMMMFLSRNEGASQKDAAQFNRKTPAAISYVVRDMLRDGYISRETDDGDARQVRLYLTPKGLDAAGKVRERLHAADREITRELTPEKEEELTATLRVLTELIEKEL